MSNNIKRAIRERMAQTGESYSTARMHVLGNRFVRPTDAEHVKFVEIAEAHARTRLGSMPWNRLLLDQSGFPDISDWDGLDRLDCELECNPHMVSKGFEPSRTELFKRAGDLLRLQMDAGVLERLLTALTDRATDLTGRKPEHVYQDRFNDELDTALDLLEAQWGDEVGCGHVLMNARDYHDYSSGYKKAHADQEETWTCGCGAEHTSIELGPGWPWEKVSDRALLQAGVYAHYRKHEVLCSRLMPLGTVLVLPDPSHLGRIRFELTVKPGDRGKGVAFQADGKAAVEIGLEPDAPVYRFTR